MCMRGCAQVWRCISTRLGGPGAFAIAAPAAASRSGARGCLLQQHLQRAPTAVTSPLWNVRSGWKGSPGAWAATGRRGSNSGAPAPRRRGAGTAPSQLRSVAALLPAGGVTLHTSGLRARARPCWANIALGLLGAVQAGGETVNRLGCYHKGLDHGPKAAPTPLGEMSGLLPFQHAAHAPPHRPSAPLIASL